MLQLRRPLQLPVSVLMLGTFHMLLDAQELPGYRRGTYLDAKWSRCMPCTDSVDFMDEEYNRQPRCRECSTCIGMMVLAAACNASHDTVCHCRIGYVKTIENLCRPDYSGEYDHSSLKEPTVTRSEPAFNERPFTDAKSDQLKTIGYFILFLDILIIAAGALLTICCISRRRKIDEKLMQRIEDVIHVVNSHGHNSSAAQNVRRITTAATSPRNGEETDEEDPEQSSRSLVTKNPAHTSRSRSSVVLHKQQGSSVTLGAQSVA